MRAGSGEGAAWMAVCSTAFTTYWIHGAGFFLLFFVALDNICSLANVMNRLKQPKVYLQLSRKSHCRYVLNKDAAAMFSSIWSPDELRA